MAGETQRNVIYSDWAMALLRKLGTRANGDRRFSTWDSLEYCLYLNEDARKRALKQKGGRGFPKDYEVFDRMNEALVQVGTSFCGPLPMLELCREFLDEHDVHIPEVERPSEHLGTRWARSSKTECRRLLEKTLIGGGDAHEGLNADEEAFIDLCAAIASHCHLEASPDEASRVAGGNEGAASPNPAMGDGSPAPRRRGVRAPEDPALEDAPGNADPACGGRPEDQVGTLPGISDVSLLLPLLQGRQCPELPEGTCGDGLGPVDYHLPASDGQLLESILPEGILRPLDASGIEPHQLTLPGHSEALAHAFACWLASDGKHRFDVLVGRCRTVLTPLCDAELMAVRAKALFRALAELSGRDAYPEGILALTIRTSHGDGARLLAGIVTELALGPRRANMLLSVLNR